MKKSLVLSLLCLGIASAVHAASEPGLPDGNVTNSLVVVTHVSTGTGRYGETRQAASNDLGELRVNEGWREVVVTTGASRSGVYGAGSSTNTFAVNTSSWLGVTGCRGIQDNCNVIRLASLSLPVFVDHVDWGWDIGGAGAGGAANGYPVALTGAGSGRTTVRMFDSQGSTDTAFEFFGTGASTGAINIVEHWCSSGVTVMVDAPGTIMFHLGKQNR